MITTHEQVTSTGKPVTSEELFLKDLLEEKRAEVSFLQAQLEQRVRKQHETEAEKETMRTELQMQLAEKEQVIQAKQEHITCSDNQLAELKQQNELLNAAVADANDRVSSLQNELEDERSKTSAAKQKLQANKQLLQRLYKEFASCIGEEDSAVPAVVTMQPSYINHMAADY